MLELVVALLCWPLALGGCLFLVAGGIGIVRLPDLYARLHAASVTDTGAAILISLALFVQAAFGLGEPIVAIKIVLILFFLLFTSPTASHALAKTALLSGHVPLGADGRPVLDSPETARRLALSRADLVEGAEEEAPRGERGDAEGERRRTGEGEEGAPR